MIMASSMLLFIGSIAGLWLVINILYTIRKELFEEHGFKLHYSVILVYRRKYTPQPSTLKRAAAWVSVPLALYGLYLFYANMVLALMVKIGVMKVAGFQQPTLLIPGINITGISLLYFVLAVVVAAAIHELAHAVTAVAYGIKVKGIGFALILFLPIAFTEIDEEEFPRASFRAKALTLMAGPASNIALALIILLVLPLLVSPTGLVVLEVMKNTPAEQYGIQPGSIILSINGKPATLATLSTVANKSLATNFTLKLLLPDGSMRVVNISKPAGSMIGVVVAPYAPALGLVNSIGLTAALALIDTLRWMYIVNLSLGMINIAPLFITDGGRLLREIDRNNYIGYIASSITLLILVLALAPL